MVAPEQITVDRTTNFAILMWTQDCPDATNTHTLRFDTNAIEKDPD